MLHLSDVRFTADEQHAIASQSLGKWNPAIDRPVFRGAATAWMNRDRFTAVCRDWNFRCEVGHRDLEIAQRTRELHGGMFAVVQFSWAVNYVLRAGAVKICREDFVGIEQIADDEIEAREVLCQIVRQLAVSREERRKRSRFDRANGVRMQRIKRKLDDVLVTEHLDVALRERNAKRANRRQRQHEVTDRAAANDEDTFQ